MRRVRGAICCFWAFGAIGCMLVETSVTNPVRGLTTVAVAPFFNLSQEPAVDGRRFAMAYFTELQKTPGFQVIPVGIVEQAIFDNKLELNGAADALKLAEILGVDAVVIGGVTDYSPYYPPRIGLQVSWYSLRPWTFFPGIPVDEGALKKALPRKNWNPFKGPHYIYEETDPCPSGKCHPFAPDAVTARGQSPESLAFPPGDPLTVPAMSGNDIHPIGNSKAELVGHWFRRLHEKPTQQQQPSAEANCPSPATTNLPGGNAGLIPVAEFNPLLPLMSYTRMFDGADAALAARLRDYVELSGDIRSGGWEGYLQRSEDFIRFSAHLMVVEMLQLHGGEGKKRVVLKVRQFR